MQDFYSVLEVGPKASEAEIKAAYRNRAKSCHPDVKPGDREAETAFQEVKRAYKFLSNPETRKTYDQYLADRRAAARVRFRRAVATMSLTFLLTATAVPVAMLVLQKHGRLFAWLPQRSLAADVAGAMGERSAQPANAEADAGPAGQAGTIMRTPAGP